MNIEVLNSAGEKVKLIIDTRITDGFKGASLFVGGQPSDIFCPEDKSLTIRLPGVNWPGNLSGAYSDFIWDGTTDGGQNVPPGTYYIKIEEVDSFGHTDTLTLQIQVIRTLKQITISIYNSAGELVRSLEGTDLPPGNVKLEMHNVVETGGNNTVIIPIIYGDGDHVIWDGKSSSGAAVSSGVYEVRAEIVNANGITTIAEKTITVLEVKSDKSMSNLKIYPNPYFAAPDIQAVPVTISWNYKSDGKVLIKFYNSAGELVKMKNCGLTDGQSVWDMKMNDGKYISSGIYVVVIDSISQEGSIQREILKFAIIIKG